MDSCIELPEPKDWTFAVNPQIPLLRRGISQSLGILAVMEVRSPPTENACHIEDPPAIPLSPR